jgi:cell fate (sporulation/competence/biofilm development) regulator YlbF (YheA/YmcA/DUF963 family)
MLVYDKAHELAKELKQCEEYKRYKEARDKVEADETARNLFKEYKKLQMKAQAAILGGGEPDAETVSKMEKLGEVLQFSQDVAQLLIAEYSFHKILSDIYKIIGDAAEVDMGFLAD